MESDDTSKSDSGTVNKTSTWYTYSVLLLKQPQVMTYTPHYYITCHHSTTLQKVILAVYHM